MARDDNERVVAARMLADLAILNPDKVDLIRSQSRRQVIGWITANPQPHANGLRFLAVRKSQKVLPQLRSWADPPDALPDGRPQPPMPDAWATAQSALRYLGWTQDPAALGHPRQAAQSPPREARRDDGVAPAGRPRDPRHGAARARVGASDGFAQWGDPKAYPMLVKYIEDPMGNEQLALRSVLRALVGRDGRADERGREEGARLQQARRQIAARSQLLPRDARAPSGAGRDRGARRHDLADGGSASVGAGRARDRLRRQSTPSVLPKLIEKLKDNSHPQRRGARAS